MDFDDRDYVGAPQKAYYDDEDIQRQVEAAYARARLARVQRREQIETERLYAAASGWVALAVTLLSMVALFLLAVLSNG